MFQNCREHWCCEQINKPVECFIRVYSYLTFIHRAYNNFSRILVTQLLCLLYLIKRFLFLLFPKVPDIIALKHPKWNWWSIILIISTSLRVLATCLSECYNQWHYNNIFCCVFIQYYTNLTRASTAIIIANTFHLFILHKIKLGDLILVLYMCCYGLHLYSLMKSSPNTGA